MIEGMRMDLKKSRYKNFDELYLYCYYVAGTVGLMSVPVMGIAPESKATTESVYGAALALGLANQLTNILRDVGEEGRIYLPQDELAQAGLSDEDIFGGKVTEKWRSFMKNQIKRARMLFQQAEAGVTELNRASRWPVWASLQLYRQILDEIEANDYNNFTKRAYVSKAKKLLALPVAYGKSLISPSSLSQVLLRKRSQFSTMVRPERKGKQKGPLRRERVRANQVKQKLLRKTQQRTKASASTVVWICVLNEVQQEDIIPKNRKDMTLRTLDDHLGENSSDEDYDDDLAFLTRKFKKFIKKNKFKNDTKNKFEPKKDQVICYKYKRPRHYKSDCPQAKKRTSKKKALKATWDDSSASEEEESNTEQVAHYDLMAIGEEVTNLIDAGLSFDELLNIFHDLFDECKTISRKYKLLKNKHDSLVSNFDKLKTEYHDIIGTKWVFRNKQDESGIVVRNKARLVTKGFNQEEDIVNYLSCPYKSFDQKFLYHSLYLTLWKYLSVESCCVSFYLYLTVKMEGSGRGGGNADVVLQNYKLGKTLGIGSFGKVKIAEHLLTGHKVAIKILNRRKIKNMEMEEKVRREIKILRLFMHPHIIHLYEVIETQSDIYVVMEYVKSGELFDYIVEKGRLQEDEARRFFQQIISGVEYCHRNMVVHRDLKPENLLLDSKCDVKIADFGLSNVMRDGHFLKTSCGSPNYAAPEVISGKLYAGPEVDVWSCGVILYALLCGTLPFDDENIPNLFKKIKGGIYTLPSHLSALARDLIPRMLIVDPMKRITIREIREHPWFQTRLPRYLAVPPPDTIMQAKKIEEDILQEVIKMGFDKNQLVESLHNRIQNEATVSYYLLLDNRFRAMSGYLGGDFQETMDYGFSRMGASEAPAIAHHLPGYMDPLGIGLRPSVPVEKKWALGLQSRAHPREIMTEVLKALRELNVCWKKIGHYNMKCRYFFGISDHAESMFNDSLHANHSVSDESAIVESDNVSGKEFSTIKFEIQLYKTREEKYLLDLQRVSGPQLLFLDLCASFLAQLRVL
ncbi:unnamed protein product [Musa hybrid cultivar]